MAVRYYCLDFAGLDAIFTKYKGIKAIIHFAASKAVGESVLLSFELQI